MIVPGLPAQQPASPMATSAKPSESDLLMAAADMHAAGRFGPPSTNIEDRRGEKISDNPRIFPMATGGAVGKKPFGKHGRNPVPQDEILIHNETKKGL